MADTSTSTPAATDAAAERDELELRACQWIVTHPAAMARVARSAHAPRYAITGPCIAAVASLLGEERDPSRNLGKLVYYARGALNPSSKLVAAATLASDLAWARGLSLTTGPGVGARDKAPDLDGKIPERTARRHQEQRRNAAAAGQTQLHAVGVDSRPPWMPEELEDDDELDPAANLPIGFAGV